MTVVSTLSSEGRDLSRYDVSDVIEVTRSEAELLIAEHWARPVSEKLVRSNDGGDRRRQYAPLVVPVRPETADVSRRTPRTAERLREIRKPLEEKSSGQQERRRAEDRIREELQDSRAKTYPQKLA